MAQLVAQTALEIIAAKRRGGEHNLKGIGYQLMYACYRILEEFSHQDCCSQFRLEGLEDVDLNSTIDTGSELIQLKHSMKPFDADSLAGGIHNFWEVYLTGTSASFLIVHNADLKKGNLSDLANGDLNEKTVSYWTSKTNSVGVSNQHLNIADFLSKISFQRWQYQELKEESVRLLFGNYGINAGVDTQYLNALFFYVFEWSKFRAIVTRQDLLAALTQITDSFSHAPRNPAIANGWITQVCFDEPSQNTGLDDYFDGRAARPEHIGAHLPVQRPRWEKKVSESLAQADAVVIHASSGQGKSTLAWQTALKLAGNGYHVYQLNRCQDWNEANALNDFLKTRLRIGQVPLIVVDNLNKQHSHWGQLLELIADMPVKILVTAREEDWHRYNSDESRARVKLISIDLSQDEARQIYIELKKRGKVAAGIDGWQPPYEQIAERGLLIEYTYLLTKGEQLASRLRQQVKLLNLERDSAAKLEILRLIAVADCMNVKLETDKLLTHVRETVGITGDRGIVIAQLENEYHVRLHRKLVEGLHPVRSQHLVAILHEAIPINSSLSAVFAILNESYVYDYAMALPGFLIAEDKAQVLEELAQILVTRRLPEIVYFLDGLMHAEPQSYWLQNKDIYDDVYQRGGLSLFVMTTIPFVELDTLQKFADAAGMKHNNNLLKLIELKKSLKPYSFHSSDISLFAGFLAKYLKGVNLTVGKLEGLEFLMRWFQKLQIDFPILLQATEETLLSALDTESQLEVKELFTYFRLKEPERYKRFLKTYKETMIGWLKVATSSLTIEERDGDIHIEYLLDNNDVDKANEYSVYRVEMVYHFMPEYGHYCTDIIILPFPSEELFEVVRMNAHKQMSSEALYHQFDAHLNQIWAHTVESNYSHLSAYHWQEAHIQCRKESINVCRHCIKLFEGFVEKNQKKCQEGLANAVMHRDAFQKLHALAKPLSRPLKYFDKPKYSKELSAINSWFGSISNFIAQFTDIVLPNEESTTSDSAHLPMVNLKKAMHQLPVMQEAFAQICAAGYSYFDDVNLDEEKETVARLIKTVQYYVTTKREKNVSPVQVARVVIENWWQQQEEQKLQQIHALLEDFQNNYGYQVFKPAYYKKQALFNIITIGIEGLDPSDIEALWDLSLGLSDLIEMDIAFAEIVFVKDGFAKGAARYNRNYFQQFQDIKNGLEPDTTSLSTPLPQEATAELIAPLAGVEIAEIISFPQIESFLKLIMSLWRLTEYRKRLRATNKYENNWLGTAVDTELKNINSTIQNLDADEYKTHEAFIMAVRAGQQLPESRDFVLLLNDYVQEKRVFNR